MPDMNMALSSGIAQPVTRRSFAWPILALAAFFGLLWLEVINQLRPEWSLNPQYAYGWSVPVLALYLLWRRWSTRPQPAPAKSRALAVALMFFLAFLLLPIRFLAEANPDWRFLSWSLAFVAVILSILSIFLIGGPPWVRHFAFPFFFFLVAVPWPVRIEQMVIQDLMRLVTAINVAFLQLAGVPALQHGNVIEVRAGFIGIEEACSGVRSLQATLMVSLFLGELYSFRVSRRLILIGIGALLAFVCNVVRTALLVWAGTTKGIQSLEAWHDPAGLTILIVCLAGLWIASLMMMRLDNAAAVPRLIDNQRAPVRFNWSLIGAICVWFVLVEGAVHVWYRSHQALTDLRWAVRWPESETNYKKISITPAAEALLRYNDGGAAAWQGADGRQWNMYFFRWLPGRTAARFVKVHRPDICLPASGRTMERDNGIRMLEVNGVTLPVRSYRFDDRGVPLHVFYCYWDARSSYGNVAVAEFEDWSARGRIWAAWQGRREIGAQMIELIVWGYHDDGEADRALARELRQIIRAG